MFDILTLFLLAIYVLQTTRMDQIFDSGVRATDADRSYRSAISYTVQDSGAYSVRMIAIFITFVIHCCAYNVV